MKKLPKETREWLEKRGYHLLVHPHDDSVPTERLKQELAQLWHRGAVSSNDWPRAATIIATLMLRGEYSPPEDE